MILFFKGDELGLKDTKNILKFVCLVLIIAAGGRYFVGADYPVYKGMYEQGFPLYTTYADVWAKATFQPNEMEIEWAYVLINKVLYDLGMPYFVVTFVLASIAITLIYKMITNYSYYPGFSFLFYFIPIYFVAECGQMRQGLGGAFVLYSAQYIIKRNV